MAAKGLPGVTPSGDETRQQLLVPQGSYLQAFLMNGSLKAPYQNIFHIFYKLLSLKGIHLLVSKSYFFCSRIFINYLSRIYYIETPGENLISKGSRFFFY